MNSLHELQEKYGLCEPNARKMLARYESRIGEKNGDYTITDITYVGNATKIVEETCSHCGAVITREMVNGRNKWSELQRFCPNEQEERMKERHYIRQLFEKNEQIEKMKLRQLSLISEIGNVYGEFTIVSTDGISNLNARCNICGNEEIIKYNSIKNGTRKDFICHFHRRTVERFTEDFIGKKNNMLEVIGITHNAITGKKEFICKCDCGKTTTTKPTWWEQGKIVSCGCYQENRSINADPEKRIKGIYRGMMCRCYNSKSKDYKMYGARGISICDEWLNNFDKFLQWSMDNGYENTRTIDRIDSNGNYEPSNCRWATYYIQNRNHRPRKKKSEYEVKA